MSIKHHKYGRTEAAKARHERYKWEQKIHDHFLGRNRDKGPSGKLRATNRKKNKSARVSRRKARKK